MTCTLLTDEEVFRIARKIRSADERADYLRGACGDNPDLHARVIELLHATDDAPGFLESPAPALAAAAESRVTEAPGTVIGPYKLLEQIGEGGFGVVFLAEQSQPVRRQVALKLIKPGMDTRQVIARFEAERQALALMDHPHIARVLDAGTTGVVGPVCRTGPGALDAKASPDPARQAGSTGRPYFVMELVRGVPITEYCDQHRLAPRERLQLFVTVCQAVQHAHQKGIIHRDIKPSNVLVTLHDPGAPGAVKIIDFGIAKAMNGRLTDGTLFTGFAQLVGTPLYMSPEQAAMSGLDVDTRSDIYSLGVLLYELLTGTTPFEETRLRESTFDEVRRIIREEEPERPSTRLGRSRLPGGTAARLDASRQIGPARQAGPGRLRQLLRGDLDWIVMKCLEKDRNRRYESAGGLARDIERHLRNEPVLARPPSSWYRFRKWAQRHRTMCAGIASVVAALLAGTALLAVSNYLISQEQSRTEAARRLAEERAEEVRQGLERLKAANALLDRGRWYAGRRQWDDACEAFTLALELQPEHVTAWVERGDLYTHLGLWDLAAADYAREIELRPPDASLRWYLHALLRLQVGDAAGYHRASRAMRDQFAGTLQALFVEETVRSCLLDPGPDADLPRLVELAEQAAENQPWSALYVAGIAHYRAGQYDLAIERLQAALEAEPQWPISRLSYPVLAMARHRLGHDTEARQALDEAARVLDRWTQARYEHHDWIIHQEADAARSVPWWDYLECQLYYREAKLLIDGVEPPVDSRLHVLRASALAELRRPEQAAAEYDAALLLSPQDPLIRLEAHRNRGNLCVDRSHWREAASEFARAAELRPDDAYLWRYRAVAHLAAGEHDVYQQVCRGMLERFAATADRATAGNVLLACALRDDALDEPSRLLPLADVSAPIWHWGDWARGAALYRAGRYEESVECFETAANRYRPRAWDWCFLSMAHQRLGHAADARRCLAEARGWINDANRHHGDDLSGTQPAWGAWHEAVVYPLLLQEAEEVLKQESAVSGQQSELSPGGAAVNRQG